MDKKSLTENARENEKCCQNMHCSILKMQTPHKQITSCLSKT